MNNTDCPEIKEKFYNFLDEWHKEFKQILCVSPSEDKMKMFNDGSYKKIETLKAMFLFKIRESLSIKNAKQDIFNSSDKDKDTDSVIKIFSKRKLVTDDQANQKFILIIILLYILKIISLKLAVVYLFLKQILTKLVLKVDLNFEVKLSEISEIYMLDTLFLAGMYLELLEQYKKNTRIK